MEAARVAIKILSGPDRKVRTGAVLAHHGTAMRVRWHDDGHEEDVKVGGMLTWAVEGSIRHSSLVEPDALRARLATDPTGLVLQLLRELGKPIPGRQITRQLREYGLETDAVSAAWKKAKPKLDEHDDVVVKNKGYAWNGPAEESVPPVATQEEPEPPVDEYASTPDGLEGSATSDNEPGEPDPGVEVELAEGRPASAAEAVSAAIGVVPAADERTLLGRPLRTGAGLGRLTNREVERLLADVPSEGAAFFRTLLLARPQKMTSLDAHHTDPAVVSSVIDAAIAEIRGTDDDDMRAAATWLLRRAVDAEGAPAPGPLVELASLVAIGAKQRELDALDNALAGLGARLRGSMRSGITPEELSKLVPQLPFGETRAELIVAAAELWPQRITDPAWWRDTAAERLADLAKGPLRRVLVRPEVAERIIAPLMARELAGVTSRARLARLLALPSEFVEHLPGADVAAAFRRAASNDPNAASWLDALEGRRRIENLRSELDAAQVEAQDAAARAGQAEAKAAEIAERYSELEKRLQGQHERAVSLRASQERQLQIDAVRALAELAAEVEELAAASAGAAVMVERVRGLVSAQELEPVGEVGEKAAFDRALHEPLMGAPAADAAVTVIRPGYRWRAGGEDVLLHRAIVNVE